MKKTLWLITRGFPFGESETSFLRDEATSLVEDFSVHIFAPKSAMPATFASVEKAEVHTFRFPSNTVGKGRMFLRALFDPDFARECFRIITSGRRIVSRIISAGVMCVTGHNILNALKSGNIPPPDIIYSYWYDAGALAAAKYKKNRPQLLAITRTHGGDLYDERDKNKWQAFKPYIDSRMDHVVFACNAAKRYYLKRYSLQDSDKYVVSYIGAQPAARVPVSDRRCIISCSNIIPVKRIEIIIDALSYIPNLNVEWHHIGTGLLADKIKEYAKIKLADHKNISVHFHGNLKNAEYLQKLQDMLPAVFITASLSEGGCPISLCEAAAAGIPMIATASGGTPEIVNRDTGLLIESNIGGRQLADAIISFFSLSVAERQSKSDGAYSLWAKSFNSINNAHAFSKRLSLWAKRDGLDREV